MNETVAESLPQPALDPNGMTARVFLAFLATAGLFYVNIMPAVVDGLIEGIGLMAKEAGDIASANVYGAAFGAISIVFLVHRIVWRKAAYVLLALLIAADLLSTVITSPLGLLVIRFAHGYIGGALVGVGFSVIARTFKPDKTFGVLLVVQFGLGGLGNLYLPRLVPIFGVDILFYSLILFSLVTTVMVPFLGEYRVDARPGSAASADGEASVQWRLLALALAATFLFQAGNMGLFAFIIGLGEAYDLDREFITWTLALSGWIGILGASLVVILHTRFGRLPPLSIAIVATALGILALHVSDSKTVFLVANCAMGITWAFVIPYLLGLCAAFDNTGRMAALGGFASKMGLASGPLVAGRLLGEDNYGLLINVSAVLIVLCLLVCIWPARVQDRVPS